MKIFLLAFLTILYSFGVFFLLLCLSCCAAEWFERHSKEWDDFGK